MNKEAVVQHMIDFIEESERDLQAVILANETKKAKADIVNRILKELEREMPDENKEHRIRKLP